MLDGLLPISEEELTNGTAHNLDAYRDCFSPFSQIDTVRPSPNNATGLWVDPQYGLVYSDWIAQGGAVYGLTEFLPPRTFDDDADLGFLRVPFARFPRLKVRSRAEVEAILARVRTALPPHGRVLLRGQTREYTLGRAPSLLNALYGTSDVIEPSLVASASRFKIDVNGIMPEWSALLRFVLDVLPSRREEDVRREWHAWFHSYSFSRFAFSIAQHYGMPSSGLDATTSLDVALFFAFRQFSVVSETDAVAAYHPKRDWSQPSVIYVFVVPTRAHDIDFKGVRPAGLPAVRPERQGAVFLHRGWGFASNDCARWLAQALYADEEFATEEIPSASTLFPGEDEDPFAAALAAFRGQDLLSEELQRLMKHLYFVQRE
jgi:hypothetical protein